MARKKGNTAANKGKKLTQNSRDNSVDRSDDDIYNSSKLNLYLHFQMDDQTDEAILKSFKAAEERNWQNASNELVYALLNIVEIRELASKAFKNSGFGDTSKDKLVDIDTLKNIRRSDVLFLTDSKVRRRVLHFFGSIFRGVDLGEKSAFVAFKELFSWLDFLVEFKGREIRSIAVTIALTLYEGLLRQIPDSEGTKKFTKEQCQAALELIRILDVHYYKNLVIKRCSDVDSGIRSHILDHLSDNYNNLAYYRLDEFIYTAIKKGSSRGASEPEIFTKAPITKEALNQLLMHGLAEGSAERAAKLLVSVPNAIKKMLAELEESDSTKDTKKVMEEYIDQNIHSLKSKGDLLMKIMAESVKEDASIHMINLYSNLLTEERLRSVVSSNQQANICFMVTHRSRKVREAAADFILAVIGKKIDTENPSKEDEESALKKFAHILSGIDKKYSEIFKNNNEFDESVILNALQVFEPRLLLKLDAKILAELFFSEDNDSVETRYYGCILFSMLNSALGIIDGNTKSAGKYSEAFKGATLESLKGVFASVKTSIKESVRKGLGATRLKAPEVFRIHIRLVEFCSEELDRAAIDTLIGLYDMSPDMVTCKSIVKLLRITLEKKKKASLFETEHLLKVINNFYQTQTENFNKAVERLKLAIKAEGRDRKSQITKATEEVKVCARKITPLRQNFSNQLGSDEASLDSLNTVMDFLVTDQLSDRELLELLIQINYSNLLYALTNLNQASQVDGTKKYVEMRDTTLEYFMYFIEPRATQVYSADESEAIRRKIFVYLMEALSVVSSDELINTQYYMKPGPEYLTRIWDFVDKYCFVSKSGNHLDRGKDNDYDLLSGEKNLKRKMDEESPAQADNNKSPTNKMSEEGEATKEAVLLKKDTIKFKADVQVLLMSVFRLCTKTLRSFGASLAEQLIHRILNLERGQSVLLDQVNLFFEALMDGERKDPSPGRLFFWKFVKGTIEKYDIATLRKLSKLVFNFFKAYDKNETFVKAKYLPFCLAVINWVQDKKDKEDGDDDPVKALLFIKRTVLGDASTNSLLYMLQENVNKMRLGKSKEEEEALLTDKKYLKLIRLRDMMASMCMKYIKDEARGPESARKSKRTSKSIGRGVEEGKMDVEFDGDKNSKKTTKGGKVTTQRRVSRSKNTKQQPERSPSRDSRNSRSGSASSGRSDRRSRSSSRGSSVEVEKENNNKPSKQRGKSKQNNKSNSRTRGGKQKGNKKPAAKKVKPARSESSDSEDGRKRVATKKANKIR